jgi:hypothetical protein
MDSYFILWPSAWCKLLAKSGESDRLVVLYGGPHTSVPKLGKVRFGDVIYPVSVGEGSLYILGKMQVEQIVDADTYLADHNISKPSNELWDTYAVKLLKQQPELGHRVPRSCVEQAAVGSGTKLRFNFGVPLTLADKLRFGPKAGAEKALPMGKSGQLSHIGLQGHFRRLSAESAASVAEIMEAF